MDWSRAGDSLAAQFLPRDFFERPQWAAGNASGDAPNLAPGQATRRLLRPFVPRRSLRACW